MAYLVAADTEPEEAHQGRGDVRAARGTADVHAVSTRSARFPHVCRASRKPCGRASPTWNGNRVTVVGCRYKYLEDSPVFAFGTGT